MDRPSVWSTVSLALMFRSIALSALFIVLVTSCTSDEPLDATSTTTEGGSTVTTGPSASTTTISVDEDDLAALLDAEMCRTLDLLSTAGVPPSTAALAIASTDLTAASSTEKADYSRRLVGAPPRECPEHVFYADEISYWLGY